MSPHATLLAAGVIRECEGAGRGSKGMVVFDMGVGSGETGRRKERERKTEREREREMRKERLVARLSCREERGEERHLMRAAVRLMGNLTAMDGVVMVRYV